MKKAFLFLTIYLATSVVASSDEIGSILDAVDKTYRSKTSWAEVEMEITTPHWKRTLKMEMWTKGLEMTLIRIKAPKKDAGIATLKRGKQMWNYFPKINKVNKVPPSMMMGSWMGSDFTNDDLVKENTYRSDYHSKFLKSEDPKIHLIELIPKEGTVSVWSKVHLKIEKKRNILLEQISYNDRGEKARTMVFSKIRKIGGKVIPTVLKLIPHKKKSNSTEVHYLNARFDHHISDKQFRRRELQRPK